MKTKGVVHSKPKPSVNKRRSEEFCGRNRNTPAGESSGTHPDQGSFQHWRSCTFSKRLGTNGVPGFQISTSMVSVPTLRSSLTYSLTTKGEQETLEWTGVDLSSTSCVSKVWLEFMPWTVSLVGVPWTFNFVARFAVVQEWLQAESHSAKIF